MRLRAGAAALAFLATGLLSGAAVGQERAPLSDSQRAFVRRYVDAIRSRDVGRLKAVVHPRSLACIRPETAAFFDDLFARQARYQVADNYQAHAQPIPAGQPLMAEDAFRYSVRPTHWIQVDLAPGATDSVIVMLQVVAERSTWYEVLPCPTTATMDKIRAATVERERAAERARALATALADPLRSRLLGLLRQGQRVSAIREYSAESGEDLAMARRVIDLFEGRER